jgi:hypothetical protein
MRYGYRCTLGVCPDVEALSMYGAFCAVRRKYSMLIMLFQLPILEPHSGVEPDDRALEERCLFRLAYEAYMMIAHP